MKFLRWLILVPVAFFAIVLAIANRHSVTFSLDPFDPLQPAIGVSMPLALIILIAMFVGILIGGAASWTRARVKTARRNAPIMPKSAPQSASTVPATQD
jgi:uncharacterized integral membrane protein